MPPIQPVPFHVIARDFAKLLKTHDAQDLQVQIAGQLSRLVGEGMLLAISYQELEARGYPISNDTKALLRVFNMLALGSGDLSLGISLPAASLDLKRLMEEVMPASTAKAIVETLPDAPAEVRSEVPEPTRLPEGIQKEPTVNNPSGVVAVDFAARRRLH